MNLPKETELSERDGRYLRKAIGWSHAARRRGNGPFGSIIVSADNEVLAEAGNDATETGDCTGHAEMNAIRALAGRGVTPEQLAGATIYASGEPCVMCAGAILWSKIGRVVIGIDADRMQAYQKESDGPGKNSPRCRDVFRASPHTIECIGPALVDEASAAFEGQ